VRQRKRSTTPHALAFTAHLQVLSAVSNAALDDAFACAVMGKKVRK
jgi:hypothetical protein